MIPVDWRRRLTAELAEMIADLDEPARAQARADLAAGRGRIAQFGPDMIEVEVGDHLLLYTAWSVLAPDPTDC